MAGDSYERFKDFDHKISAEHTENRIGKTETGPYRVPDEAIETGDL